jgi:flagellar M-ring protein FliF
MKLKPIVGAILKPAPPARKVELLTSADGELVERAPARPQPDRYETTLSSAKQIAKEDPKIVANVVKQWVAGNEQ